MGGQSCIVIRRRSADRRPAIRAYAFVPLILPAVPSVAAVERRADGVAIYAHEPWVPWAVGAGAAVLLACAVGAVARLRRTRSARAGWVAGVGLGLGGVALLVMAVGLPRETLAVRPEGSTWTRGVRLADVRYADCARVELVTEPIRGRFGVEGHLHALRWHFRDARRPPVSIPLEGPSMAGRFRLVSGAAAKGVGGADMLMWRITTLR